MPVKKHNAPSVRLFSLLLKINNVMDTKVQIQAVKCNQKKYCKNLLR